VTFSGIKMKKYSNIITGIVLMTVSVMYFLQTLSINKIAFIDPLVGSARFPQIIAVILALCAGILIFQGMGELKNNRNKVAENSENADSEVAVSNKKGNLKIVLVLGSFALFAFLMDKIGFAIDSFIYLWSQMVIMSHEKQTRKSVLIYGLLSIVISAAIFTLFRYGFGLILPRARWF
jgi:Tripartite tricarboxylate transporter TctB family.